MFRNPLIDAIVVLLVVLLIFGPKRLPELGKGLGKGMREFKEGITGESKDDDESTPSIPASNMVSDPAAVRPADRSASGSGSAEVGSERRS
jgi:sec-independent protein translocase protein TatA